MLLVNTVVLTGKSIFHRDLPCFTIVFSNHTLFLPVSTYFGVSNNKHTDIFWLNSSYCGTKWFTIFWGVPTHQLTSQYCSKSQSILTSRYRRQNINIWMIKNREIIQIFFGKHSIKEKRNRLELWLTLIIFG